MIATVATLAQTTDGDVSTISVSAEPTDAAGLFITPEVRGGKFSGTFCLTHGPSGLRLPAKLGGGGLYGHWFAPDEIDVARRVAAALATTPVDWTADGDTVARQINEHQEAVRNAVRSGKFPPPGPDDEDRAPGDAEGPAPYPRTEAQATADAMARHLTRAMQHRSRESFELIGEAKASNPDGMRRYLDNLHAFIAEWGLVYMLREVAELDQQVADRLARNVFNAWEDGGSVAEFSGEWAAEYGLPEDDQDDTPAPERPVGIRLMTEAGKLPYYEGSVDDLRRAVAHAAAQGEKRFGEMLDAARGTDGPMPPDHVRDIKIAHHCAQFGWTLVAVLRWLRELHPGMAARLAAMLDDIGTNGGNDFMDDIDPHATTTNDTQPVPA